EQHEAVHRLNAILGNVGSLALAGVLLAGVTISGADTAAARTLIVRGCAIFYLATAGALLLTTILTLVWTPETRLTAVEVQAQSPQPRGEHRLARGLRTLRALWLEPWKSHNFTWVFLTRAFVMLGLTLFLTFIEYYFANVAHVTDFVSKTALVAGLALVGALLSALALGILSDRMNRALLVGVSSGLMAIPALLFVVAAGRIPLWPLGIVFGLGYGAYTSVDWALAVDALPVQANAGKDLGIWSAASTLPAILAPALGGVVIGVVYTLYHQTALGYQAVFALAAAFLALGAICVSFISGEPGVRQPTAATGPTRRRPGRGWRLAGGSHSGRARGFLRFWPVWEWVMRMTFPSAPIPDAPYGLLRARLKRHHGRPITLPDGASVARGDWVVELHFANSRLITVSPTTSAWRLVHMLAGDLTALARAVGGAGELSQARAVVGLTLMGRAGPRLGFTVRERPVTLYAWFDRFFMRGLMAMYHPDGAARLARGGLFSEYPLEVWMSREQLLRRYGAAPDA
ncbi:MAG: MFS transporter, partial [Chloroflexota bacterium]|nr:MFS transporter [Chloroflexota bacterium]